MKANNAKTVQSLVLTVHEGIANGYKTKTSMSAVQGIFEGCHDAKQAASLARDTLIQAILQGYAEVIVVDGKRNDKTSNWKRNLANAFNKAYPTEPTKLSFKTAGKGQDRTVSIVYTPKVATSDRAKFEKRITTLLSEANATEAEASSLTGSILGLYDKEQERLEARKVADQVVADEAKANAAAAITARVSDQLEKAGFKATARNIEIAAAMTANA